jgi:hypothetical protein
MDTMGKRRLSASMWVKSSYSGDNGGNCIEIAPGIPGVVPVRDSKAPDGHVLLIPVGGWASFISGVRCGEFRPG